MPGEDEQVSGVDQSAVNGQSLGSPSRKRRKSSSAQAGEAAPGTPLSAASTASSLNALADATVSLGSTATVLSERHESSERQHTVIERMQRQLEVEREARQAAESDTRRLEEHVQRLEQNHRHTAQHQHNHTSTAPLTLLAASHSAPSTPPHHPYVMPAPTNGLPLSSSSSPYLTPQSSSHVSSLAVASLSGLPHAARTGVLAADLSKLFPAVSAEDDSDERGVSCHQCKSNKPKHLLLFCTVKADSSGRKRRCRKKYCHAANTHAALHHAPLVINHMSAEDLISWRCPSCLNSCSCAACLRRGVGSSPSSTAVSNSPSAAQSVSSSTVTSPTQQRATAAATPPARLTSAPSVAGGVGLAHQSVSASSPPILAQSAPPAPPTLLHGFPYPLAMSGMPAAIPIPFAFQPFTFRPAMVAAAAAAAAASASSAPSITAMPSVQSVQPTLLVPTSPAAQPTHVNTVSAGMSMGGIMPHFNHMHFGFPLMPHYPLASPPSTFASSAHSPPLVFNGVRSGLPQPQPQHSRLSKQPTPVEVAQARNGEVHSAVAAG